MQTVKIALSIRQHQNNKIKLYTISIYLQTTISVYISWGLIGKLLVRILYKGLQNKSRYILARVVKQIIIFSLTHNRCSIYSLNSIANNHEKILCICYILTLQYSNSSSLKLKSILTECDRNKNLSRILTQESSSTCRDILTEITLQT